MNNISTDILSNVTTYMKYSRYLENEKRRETWQELVTRNKSMHVQRWPELEKEIEQAYQLVYDKKVLPSMRALQFGGKPIEINPARIYNCAYMPIDHPAAFSEVMFLLLGGTGVGYSVQKHHIAKLPMLKGIIHPKDNRQRKKRFLIGDSIEGWADAIKILINSYYNGTKEIEFDYRDIRPKGAQLITSGGKAPGPQPLKDCVHNITKILDNAIAERGIGTKLGTLEVNDIICYIADGVLAGGIRRAALIALFSFDDDSMLSSKMGNWWELNPQRGRANNSVVAVRHRIKKDDFYKLWQKIRANGTGEPGIYFTNDAEWGANPCVEIALRAFQFCNLTTINASNIESQEDLNERARSAAFIGTLQTAYTDFHYLRDIWRETTEKDSLLGVSMTGIASGKVFKFNMVEAAGIVKKENARIAKKLGVNKAARLTCVKPEGTSSLVLGTSSGIHAWHNGYYIRRIRVHKNEAIYQYMKAFNPDFVEDDFFKPDIQAVLSFPVEAPRGAITRKESALHLLDRVKQVNENWVAPGHRKGHNTHNVSCTVTVKEKEWDEVIDWMWDNREIYNGLAVLPFDGTDYPQMPFEDCSKKTYQEMLDKLQDIDVSLIREDMDMTKFQQEIACGGGACEVVSM